MIVNDSSDMQACHGVFQACRGVVQACRRFFVGSNRENAVLQ